MKIIADIIIISSIGRRIEINGLGKYDARETYRLLRYKTSTYNLDITIFM